MNVSRIFTAVVPAAIITALLVLAMQLLISQQLEEQKGGNEYKIPDISMPDQEISTEYDTRKPDKPDEPEEPPPELPEPEFENIEADTSISVAPNVSKKINIGGIGGFTSDGDYLPIVKTQAKYPNRALSRGLEGYCTVEYTVTKTGETRDVKVADCPKTIFAKSSIKAAAKFKYKPKVIDGEAIEVPGVRNRFIFKIGEE
ncbi:MAG: energy transducer TonB [Agarilytica sp.]